MSNFQNTAQGLASLGRYGDSSLVHMSPEEVNGLQNLAIRNGTSLTTNPQTGMPEAFSLTGFLPMIAGGALTAASGGAISPLMAGLMIGGATAVVEGDLGAGIGAGLGAYGGGSLFKSLDTLGQEAIKSGGTTGEFVGEQLQSGIKNLNPSTAGFESNSGIMGVEEGFAQPKVNPNYPAAFQNTGKGLAQTAQVNPNYSAAFQNTQPPVNRSLDYTKFGGGTNNPPVNNLPEVANPNYPRSFQTTTEDITQFGPPKENLNTITNSQDPLTNLSNKIGTNLQTGLDSAGRGIDTLFNDYDKAKELLGRDKVITGPDGDILSTERVPLDNIDMAMKFGMPVAGGIASGIEESDFSDPINMSYFKDTRFKGPGGQLNLAGATGLNLNNPFGYAEGGYLGGGDINVQGDGMSDDIPANIDGEQEAALSEGEFVVPADVVSHIGNGSSEAGAEEFYNMMDRVRMARTGREKQAPEIDPERFMPA